MMDSQLVKENTMFIAINNGNQYIDEAILKGASFIITDRKMKNISMHQKLYM